MYDLSLQYDFYIAGPMTGHPNYNFGSFYDAEARLAARGLTTVNPARHDEDEGWVIVQRDRFGGILRAFNREAGVFDWGMALDWDLKAIDRCKGIYLLPGWSKSRGATKEYEYAIRTGKVIVGAVNERPAGEVRSEPLVGLIGFARCGKDTLAQALGYQRIAFADPLKRLAAYLNPLTTGSEGGLLPLETLVEVQGWEKAKEIAVNDPWGTRPHLQRLGVGVREILGADTWVEAAFKSYDPSQATVFTDVRFPNEVAAIKDRGGVIVRVTRETLNPPNAHVSEQLVRTIEPDYEITAPYHGIEILRGLAAELDQALRTGGPVNVYVEKPSMYSAGLRGTLLGGR